MSEDESQHGGDGGEFVLCYRVSGVEGCEPASARDVREITSAGRHVSGDVKKSYYEYFNKPCRHPRGEFYTRRTDRVLYRLSADLAGSRARPVCSADDEYLVDRKIQRFSPVVGCILNFLNPLS